MREGGVGLAEGCRAVETGRIIFLEIRWDGWGGVRYAVEIYWGEDEGGDCCCG